MPAIVAVAGAAKSIFEGKPLSQQLYLPPFLEACRDAIERNREQDILPIGITYAADVITLSYNLPLNNHSGACQLIYNTITQECFCAVQYFGQSRGRWEQIALVAGISPELSGLALDRTVGFDRTAGIVAWTWKIERTAQMPVIIDYINLMSRKLSFENDLVLDDLYKLYKGSGNPKAAVRAIITRNMKRLGLSSTSSRLLAGAWIAWIKSWLGW